MPIPLVGRIMGPNFAWRYTAPTNLYHSKYYLWGPSTLRSRHFSSGTGPIWKCYQCLPDREIFSSAHNKRAAGYFADNAPIFGLFSCYRNEFRPHDFKNLNKEQGSLSRHQIMPKIKRWLRMSIFPIRSKLPQKKIMHWNCRTALYKKQHRQFPERDPYQRDARTTKFTDKA